MDVGSFRFVVVFLALFCVFAVNNSEGNRKLGQSFTENGVSSDFQDIDQDTVDLRWSYCKRELNDSTNVSNDLYFDLSHSKISIEKATADLTPSQKEIIIDCLKKERSFAFAIRGEEESWFNRYQNLLPSWGNVPRRYLRRSKRRNRFVIAPIPGPALSPSNILSQDSFSNVKRANVPSPSPSPSPSPVSSILSLDSFSNAKRVNVPPPSPSPSPSPVSDSPSPALKPPVQAPEPSPFEEPPLIAPSTLEADVPTTDSSKNEELIQKYLIVAVVSGVVAGLALLALFLVCCLTKKRNKVEPKDGQRDENPLLNFSDNHLSTGNRHPVTSQKANSTLNSAVTGSTFHDSPKPESPEGDAEKSNSNLSLPPGKTGSPSPGPPPPPPKPPAPAPPPPPKANRPPPPVPKPAPPGPHRRGRSSTGNSVDATHDESEGPKTKLKPFFWDKVMANPDQSMVWHELKAGSFQVNEEMMESLFGYAQQDKNKNENKKDGPSFEPPKFIQIIDPKKSQNLAILLKALNVTTDEVCAALMEGNELPAELIQTLVKMAPTSDEELKLRLYNGELSQLGPAERFLKVMVDIPFAFKRLESLMFVSTYLEEVSSIKDALATLEVACTELRNSRLFLKLLEAVLKTGNRMNDGTYRGGAQAFKLDTLLKLSDVKGTDGKTTLLHFVIHEIIRSEGLRAARRLRESQSMSSVKTEDLRKEASHGTEEYHRKLGLQVIAGLSNELENVKKAAVIDNEVLDVSVSKLSKSLLSTRRFLEKEMKSLEGENEFRDTLTSFVDHVETDIKLLTEEEKRIMDLVKSTGDYFHGQAKKDEGTRLFVIIRDFLSMLDKACKDVMNSTKFAPKSPTREESLPSSPSQDSNHHETMREYHRRLFPSIKRRYSGDDDDFSSDEEK